MAWRRIGRIVHPFIAFAVLASPNLAAASSYHGQVTFGGLPLPGATVTVTQGAKKLSTVSEQGGNYNFPDLTDGLWKVEIQMLCFSNLHGEVTVASSTPAGEWELTLLPLDQIATLTTLPAAPSPSPGVAPAQTKASSSSRRRQQRRRDPQTA